MLWWCFNTDFILSQIPKTRISFICKKSNLPLTIFTWLARNQLCKPLEGIFLFKLMSNSREEVRDTGPAQPPYWGAKEREPNGWRTGNVPLRLVRIPLVNGRCGRAAGVAVKCSWKRPAPRPPPLASASWERKLWKWWKSRHYFQTRWESQGWRYHTQLPHTAPIMTIHVLSVSTSFALQRKVTSRQSSMLVPQALTPHWIQPELQPSKHNQCKTTRFINTGQAI